MAFAPALPIGISSALIFSATSSASLAGRVRLTTIRGVFGQGASGNGRSVRNTRSRPGRATAPISGLPSMASATCTAQSVRSSPYSRVPSTGSMIQTRDFERRSRLSFSSSDNNPSSGRCVRRAWQRNSLAVSSPALPSACPESTPEARTSSSSLPATCARCAASSASFIAALI